MAPFCYVSPVSSFCFCIYIISTGTSGNMSVAQVYVCMNVYFPPFWNYVGGIDGSIMTANNHAHVHILLSSVNTLVLIQWIDLLEALATLIACVHHTFIVASFSVTRCYILLGFLEELVIFILDTPFLLFTIKLPDDTIWLATIVVHLSTMAPS
jgi:hypothetical protein